SEQWRGGNIRAVPQGAHHVRYARQEGNPRRAVPGEIPGAVEAVSRRIAQAGDDRIQELVAAKDLPLALTIGEPAGIGPDIALMAWRRRRELKLPAFYLVADPDFVARRAQALKFDIPVKRVAPPQANAVFADALPVVALDRPITAKPGEPDGSSPPAAIGAIRRAFGDVMTGQAAAMVTNPIAKAVLYRADFPDPGHTEFLGRLAAERSGRAVHPVMMIWSEQLAVVPVTIHIPLRDVKKELTTDLVLTVSRIVAHDLKLRFG